MGGGFLLVYTELIERDIGRYRNALRVPVQELVGLRR